MELSLNLLSCSLTSSWGTDDAETAHMQIKIIPASPRPAGNFDIFICSSWIKAEILLLIGTYLDVVLCCGKSEGQGISVADLDLIHIHLDAAVSAITGR